MTGDEEIVQAFLEESRENLDQLDRDLVDLESQPDDPALLARIFRTIHTVKGTCGFLGFSRLESLAHTGENLLGALRDGDLVLNGAVTTSLLALVDGTRRALHHIETTGTEGDDDHAAVIADLARHLSPGVSSELPQKPLDPAPVLPRDASPTSESSVRVEVAVLDKLLDLVGELVLARSQIADLAVDQDEGPLALPYRQLRLVTSELQQGVMQARLQPVGAVIGKFPRIARDLAAALNKKVRVEIEGDDVGVDKAVNEALRDPLLHLVRNAVDHGLESESERLAAGKPAAGSLHLRVRQEGGRVQVEVTDDGRGIDVERLVQRTVALGFLTAEQAAALSAAEQLELMFRAGLTTKDEVSNVSGRGVGMDVVRTSLAQVGGSILVTSERGQGSIFRINVPLTLAIMPALVVWCGGGRYALPQVDVHEIVRVEQEEMESSVDAVSGVRLLRLRGRLLPLVELAQHFAVAPAASGDGMNVVVVDTGGRRFGIVVDTVGDTTEAVVKPLPCSIRSIPLFAGVTILSDGQPSLILDVAGLANAAAIGLGGDERSDDVTAEAGCSGASLLLADGENGGRLAFHLDLVQRLEQFRCDRVELTGATEVVQYGDVILPLIRVSEALASRRAGVRDDLRRTDSDVFQAVVCSCSIGLVGMVVDRIEDVVGEPATPRQPASRRGVTACLVVEDRVTELVDVEALVAEAGLARSA